MVGALSIVRFRTPIKDSIDLTFLFWAIAIGIGNGVSLYNVTVTGSILISLILLTLARIKEVDGAYLMTVRMPNDKQLVNSDLIKDYLPKKSKIKLRSKAVNTDFCEYIFDLRLANDDTGFVKEISKNLKNTDINLISYKSNLAMD
jgi:uncharacterized membrane protein YhiD involved in acid resistance